MLVHAFLALAPIFCSAARNDVFCILSKARLSNFHMNDVQPDESCLNEATLGPRFKRRKPAFPGCRLTRNPARDLQHAQCGLGKTTQAWYVQSPCSCGITIGMHACIQCLHEPHTPQIPFRLQHRIDDLPHCIDLISSKPASRVTYVVGGQCHSCNGHAKNTTLPHSLTGSPPWFGSTANALVVHAKYRAARSAYPVEAIPNDSAQDSEDSHASWSRVGKPSLDANRGKTTRRRRILQNWQVLDGLRDVKRVRVTGQSKNLPDRAWKHYVVSPQENELQRALVCAARTAMPYLDARATPGQRLRHSGWQHVAPRQGVPMSRDCSNASIRLLALL
eukprot:365219-Chlamydomonas_euryale.AAC.28